MTESQVQTKLLAELNKFGWFYKATDRIKAGIPDVLGVYQGQFFVIEIKVGYNKATPLQKYTMEQITASGGVAYVVTFKHGRYEIGMSTFSTTKETVAWILKHRRLDTNWNAST